MYSDLSRCAWLLHANAYIFARWRLGDLEGAQADLEQILATCPDQAAP